MGKSSEPGDILATGTHSGIGAPTGRFLKPGDRMRREIEALGHIESEITAETVHAPELA